VLGTFELLEAIRAFGDVHLHHVSTDEVYGDIAAPGRAHEDSPYRPRSPYSASKAAADHLVMAWAHTYGASVSLSTSANNYGPRQFPEKLVPLAILRCLRDLPIPVYGDGLQVRGWLHVDDHARALCRLLTAGGQHRQYVVGAEAERTNLAMLTTICRAVAQLRGLAPETLLAALHHVDDRPGHDRRYAASAERIQAELGFRPEIGLEQGIADTVAWYANNATWVDEVMSGDYRRWNEEHCERLLQQRGSLWKPPSGAPTGDGVAADEAAESASGAGEGADPRGP
jgi:dTDP-glucose 4,6-dehydratase